MIDVVYRIESEVLPVKLLPPHKANRNVNDPKIGECLAAHHSCFPFRLGLTLASEDLDFPLAEQPRDETNTLRDGESTTNACSALSPQIQYERKCMTDMRERRRKTSTYCSHGRHTNARA